MDSPSTSTINVSHFPENSRVSFRAHLHPVTVTRLRCHCDVAPEWLTRQFTSDITAMSQLLGLTVQHQNNRLDLGAMSQRRRSR